MRISARARSRARARARARLRHIQIPITNTAFPRYINLLLTLRTRAVCPRGKVADGATPAPTLHDERWRELRGQVVIASPRESCSRNGTK
jgi:hypothetical protein